MHLRVGFVVLEGNLVCSGVADCAGSPNKAATRMNHAATDGSMTARRVDWVRPAKDTTVVAGEQPGCFWHVTDVHFSWIVCRTRVLF